MKNKTSISPEHKHAVANVEQDFGLKIRHIVKTYETEAAARASVRNGDKGTFPVRILCGQAYARLTEIGWLLDGEMTEAEKKAANE